MLDGAFSVMLQNSVKGLRSTLSFGDLARVAGIRERSARDDWRNGSSDGSKGASNNFIAALVQDRLYGDQAPWISETMEEIYDSWLRDSPGKPRVRFVEAMSKNFELVRDLPATIPGWYIHMITAGGLLHEQLAGDDELDPEDLELVHKLADLRREFYADFATMWLPRLRVVLTEMGRRPKPGVSEEAIVFLLHTFLNGLVVRQLVDEITDDDGFPSAGQAMLAFFDGLTEPDLVTDSHDDDVATWVRQKAVEVTIARHRVSHEAGETSLAAIQVDQIGAALPSLRPTADAAELERLFNAEFSTMSQLRELALRKRLKIRVDAVLDLRSIHPPTVIRQLMSSVLEVRETDGFLLEACRREQAQGASSYFEDFESTIVSLLEQLRTKNGPRLAHSLLDNALAGDASTVDTLLTFALDPAEDDG
jgi:hypothetical protein